MAPATGVRTRRNGSARTGLLEAAVALIRAKGLTATTVDDLCAAAGVTKGAFFHHFDTKELLAVAAVEHWSETTGALFASASYHDKADPLDRVLGYIDLRADLIRGRPAEFSCLAGTMTQEVFESSPAVRDACAASIFGHAATLEADLIAAIHAHPPAVKVTAASLARHIQAVIQGAFILAKAADDPALALDSIEHLRRYVQLVFSPRVQPPISSRKRKP
jgi:TetR/AcrR family transcriptional regulator, transcriptional repressor for nem operon